jgi:hypothetical protein
MDGEKQAERIDESMGVVPEGLKLLCKTPIHIHMEN